MEGNAKAALDSSESIEEIPKINVLCEFRSAEKSPKHKIETEGQSSIGNLITFECNFSALFLGGNSTLTWTENGTQINESTPILYMLKAAIREYMCSVSYRHAS